LHRGEGDGGTPNPAQRDLLQRFGFLVRAAQDEKQEDDATDSERLKRERRASEEDREKAKDLE
jgi:hypothetical protein